MSVKGFKVGSSASEQYDYNYLDNKPDLSVYATKTEVAAVDDQALAAYATDTATGAIASLSDGADGIPMKSVLCAINPVQELHGYNAPWPAGGGKNKFNPSQYEELDLTGSGTIRYGHEFASGTYTIINTFSSVIYYRLPASDYSDRGSSVSVAAGASVTVTADASHVLWVFMATAEWATAASLVCVNDGNDATFAPYSNICPISGFTGLTLTRTGKNLLDNSALVHGGLNGNTGASGTTDQRILTDYLFFKAGTYTVSRTSDSIITRVVLCVYDLNENYLIDESYAASWNTLNWSFTLTADRLVRFAFAMATNDTIDLDAAKGTLQIELGSTATAYAPYQGSTYPVSWQSSAGTVYGGTLDVVSGVLTVTMASVTENSASGWNVDAGNQRCHKAFTNIVPGPAASVLPNILANYLRTITFADGYVNKQEGIFISKDSISVSIHIDGITDTGTQSEITTALGSYLSSNPLQICYELATPQTYNLTPTEVDSLLGLNNLWHDANGNTTANYRADVTLYIAKKIAAVQALILEN